MALAVLTARNWTLPQRADGKLYMSPEPGTYNVYPIIPGGVLDGWESIITNQAATWQVVSNISLGGFFTFYDGGAWSYISGSTTGVASFTWEVIDYDGQGNTAGATHSFNVV